MKLILLKENIKQMLGVVERIASSSSSLPVLKNILIKATEGTITVSATNLELAIAASVPGKVAEKGSVTIPAQVFSSIINNVSSEKITLETNDGAVSISTDNYQAAVQTIKAEEFPIIPKNKNTAEYIEIDGKTLKLALEQVIYAAASEAHFRQELNGVFIAYQKDALKIAATDSFRLAECTIPAADITSTCESGYSVIIPAKNAQELIRTLPQEAVRIYNDASQIVFTSSDRMIVSRVIEGKFPEYQQIIPRGFDCELTAAATELSEGLKLMNVFAGRLNDCKLTVHPDKRTLELTSQEAGIGENKYVIPVKSEGDPLTVTFNAGYLADGIRTILRSTKSDSVKISLNKETKPSVVRPSSGTGFLYILMPIKQN